jgi:hypothetical protein
MRRSEYQKRAKAFRARLQAEAKKTADQRVWPDMEDWLSTPGTSTCTTPTCPVFGQSFPVTLYENADGIYRGQCGRCKQSITPVPVLEDD